MLSGEKTFPVSLLYSIYWASDYFLIYFSIHEFFIIKIVSFEQPKYLL